MNLASFSKVQFAWGQWAGGPTSCSLSAVLLRTLLSTPTWLQDLHKVQSVERDPHDST
jgi:hypothetical protein